MRAIVGQGQEILTAQTPDVRTVTSHVCSCAYQHRLGKMTPYGTPKGDSRLAAIIISAGNNEGHYFPLGQRTTVIGRQETCPIQIVDDKISRKHVQIRFDAKEKRFYALDMKSANGTCINGIRIDRDVPLEDFDEIQVGDTKLVFIAADFPDHKSALDHYKR